MEWLYRSLTVFLISSSCLKWCQSGVKHFLRWWQCWVNVSIAWVAFTSNIKLSGFSCRRSSCCSSNLSSELVSAVKSMVSLTALKVVCICRKREVSLHSFLPAAVDSSSPSFCSVTLCHPGFKQSINLQSENVRGCESAKICSSSPHLFTNGHSSSFASKLGFWNRQITSLRLCPTLNSLWLERFWTRRSVPGL